MSPVGCLAFKASEVLQGAWWVRLLPLPPFSSPVSVWEWDGVHFLKEQEARSKF